MGVESINIKQNVESSIANILLDWSITKGEVGENEILEFRKKLKPQAVSFFDKNTNAAKMEITAFDLMPVEKIKFVMSHDNNKTNRVFGAHEINNFLFIMLEKIKPEYRKKYEELEQYKRELDAKKIEEENRKYLEEVQAA